MQLKERVKSMGSPKVGVGEIDTRAPFQSVKDAVNLFGEVAFSAGKRAIRKEKPLSAEKVWAKETQLHLAQKSLRKLQEQLRNAESTKAEASNELERARKTVEELTQKLRTINDAKDAAIRATEAAKEQARQLEESSSANLSVTISVQKQDLESAVDQSTSALSELNAAKQELAKTRQDFDAYLEAKAHAASHAADAELAIKLNEERAREISKELAGLKETIEQVRHASSKAQPEQAKIFSEKVVERQSYRASLDESAKKLEALKKEFDPEHTKNLESQLEQTMDEIGALQKEMEKAKASDADAVKVVTSELGGAKGFLQKILEEEIALKSLVETLKLELENLRKEHAELREKEAETESIAGNLHVKLRKSKSELENCLAEEAKTKGVSDEMVATLNQLSSEAENAWRDAEDMKMKAGELQKEAEATRVSLEEAEKMLKVALEEAEEAKAAEASALDQIKILSERTDVARSSTSESGAKITISREEFESLSHKVADSDKLAEMKVAAAMAQVEAVRASENEALKRLETAKKEIDDMKAATEEALRKAEMAEAAKKAVEGELRRWREREQKKAAEAAARILAETQSHQPSQAQAQPQPQPEIRQVTFNPSPVHHKFQKQNSPENVKKLEKQKTSVSKKVLMSNFSGIFHRKKSQIEAGSPSYLPGEQHF